jgi:hypothetical protein
MFCNVAETTKCSVIERDCIRPRAVNGGWVVYIVEPEPGREMWLLPVEKALHPRLDIQCYVLKLGMVDPVLSRIRSQGGVPNLVPVNVVVKLKEYG